MTSMSKNVYIDKLGYMVNKYKNTYHRTIKMKSAHVKASAYIDSDKEINDKNPKFEIGGLIRISKHQNIFAKGYVLSWSEDVFVIKKSKKQCSLDICY